MSLLETLTTDMKAAMKARDQGRLSVLRMLIAGVQLQQKEAKRDLTESEEIEFLATSAKRRRESIDAYAAAARADLADVERAELVVIESYLPAQLTPDEAAEVVRRVIDEVGATSKKDMGKVMAAVMPSLRGRFDGKAAKDLVGSLLPG